MVYSKNNPKAPVIIQNMIASILLIIETGNGRSFVLLIRASVFISKSWLNPFEEPVMSNPPKSREYIANEFRSPLAMKNPKKALKTTSEDSRNFIKETNAFNLVKILTCNGVSN